MTQHIEKIAIGAFVICFLGVAGAVLVTLGSKVSETISHNSAELRQQQELAHAAALRRAETDGIASEFLRNNPEYSLVSSSDLPDGTEFQADKSAASQVNLKNAAEHELPNLLKGSLPAQTLSTQTGAKATVKPPRMCDMPEDYFEKLAENEPDFQPGYTETNGFVRRYKARRGMLNEREMLAAKVAWGYFEKFTQETTGLANSVGSYPSTTLWDTASYVSGLVAAYELCLIEKPEFDKRLIQLLTTIKGLKLFRNEMPNKVYHTKTGAQVDYTNKPGEIGFSALDIGRFMVWMRICRNRYPYLANTIDNMLLKWDYTHVVDEEGIMWGAAVDKETKETIYTQEGRLGYEEYAAKGFALWGFKPYFAHRAEPFLTTNIFDVRVPYDGRDPRVFHSQNYVVTESYLLDGLELDWDMPHDDVTSDHLHSDGWRAEFADRIYQVQHNRFEREGFMTARSEHNVKGPPYFTYDTIFSDGYPWNTVTPRGDYSPDHAAIATKAAFGLWSLWESYYTDILYDAVIELFDPERGFYEGLYEGGNGHIEIQTANNNGILLASLLHKVQGKILTPGNGGSEVWYTRYRDRDIRIRKNLPDPPQEADWLPAYRHPAQLEETQ
ncbi:hypothetical protein GCM10007939_15670 [Amylibacter marinus]|uniref:DUF3131 domain-containing protein n=1 Tax=Amylibacter marinus TaxID=1475483 RepID=A0ABQ5VVW0_9RHOB|nr:DUF3131 domain-containing protein [Amylibacter marinus]GLQ35284.1 hypothetical protein GCM10007939_15670 [Amylibacter marinus]